MENRNEEIIEMLPKKINTVLDIGSLGDIFKSKFITTSIDILPEADIVQNLNLNQELQLEDNSFDIVVMNQILEHLPDVSKLISEAKRISKKYILVGLPNEVTYDNRLKVLFGKPQWKGYLPFFHKHYFTIDEIDKFVKKFFDGEIIDKKYFFACAGGKFIPSGLQKVLVNIRPHLFAKEVYYLIKKKTPIAEKANNSQQTKSHKLIVRERTPPVTANLVDPLKDGVDENKNADTQSKQNTNRSKDGI